MSSYSGALQLILSFFDKDPKFAITSVLFIFFIGGAGEYRATGVLYRPTAE
jgi:hypothetical protein